MSHVFLSYARSDVERAKQIAGALEAHGFSVWWDRTIAPGKTFDQVIEEALEKADKVVVLWSADALASNWVRTEADVALEKGILVPVLIEDVLPPFSSRRIEAAELQRWTGDPKDPELQNLVAALRGTGYIHVRAEDLGPEGEPERSPEPAPPPPVPQPHSARRSRRGLKVAFGVAAVLAVLGIGLAVVVAIAIDGMRPEPKESYDPPPVEDDRGSDPGPVYPPEPPQPLATVAPPSATITLRYTGDLYDCRLNLDFEVGGRRFAPQSSVHIVSDLPEGPTPYAISGVISCPTIGACTARGAGTLNVYDGALYDLVWQNTTYGQCQTTLIEANA